MTDAANRSPVRERLRSVWVDALELGGPWSEDAGFFELGGYSLLALSVADRISREFGVAVPRTLVFEHPTFNTLADRVAELSPAHGDDPAASAPAAAEAGDGSFPMSPLQQAYLLGEAGGFELASPALFVEEYRCARLDVDAFAGAVLSLIRRHGMLRAAFAADGSQRVLEAPAEAPVQVRDLTGWGEGDIAAELARSGAELVTCPPPPDSGTVLVFRVFRLPEGYHVQVCGRLLVFDGRSGDVFADELRALLSGADPAARQYTYRQYRLAVEHDRGSAEHAAARQYWLDRVAALPAAPQLPYRHGSGGPSPRRRVVELETSQWNAFKATAQRHNLTVTVALCAVFCEVLRHFSAEPDFTVNVMYGERRGLHPDVSGVVGNFSDTLLLECRAGGVTFVDRARALGARLVADLAHGSFGGVEVIRELNRRRGAGSGAAMPVVFASVIGGESQDGIFLERLGWQRVAGRIHTPQVCLDHQVFDTRDRLVAHWDTADGLFRPGVLDAMVAAYRRLLELLCAEPAAWHEHRFPLTPAGQLAVRAEVNDTDTPIPARTLHGPVFEQARRTPGAVAVVAPDAELTYAELVERATGVAARLSRAGCRPGDLVLVHQQRGWRQVVALLGALAAGAGYVPLGPAWPRARIRAVVAASGARHLLTDEPDNRAAAVADGLTVVPIDGAEPGGRHGPATAGDPESRAYVIFTSGTTGEPKGVTIRHAAAANTVADVNSRFAVTAEDRVLALSEVTFDLSVYDVFGPLAVGASVVVPDADQAADIAALDELVRRTGVTVWNSVPAFLSMLVDYRQAAPRPALPRLRLAMASGDWVPVDLGGRLAAELPGVRLVSLGGATEASIWSNWFPVPREVPAEWTSIPYGHPLANQRFRVMDEAFADRPDWVPGDLYIAGRGLADGYLNQPGLTAESFVVHPADGERLYRTGDRACYWPDGTLEFLGRRDDQVKVNGFRVELGEVDAALLAQPGVRAAAAVLRQDGRGGSLVAHVVADAVPGTEDRLIAALRGRLPDYLVPRSVLVHERLPLTANGKVDRGRLAAVSAGTADSAPGALAVTAAEERLLCLWRAVVPVRGVTDDFFQAGGHSLAAAALMNAVEREFGVRLPLTSIYQRRTVRDLAPLLARQEDDGPALVRLGGTGDPVLLIHPVGGDVLCYQPLAERLAAQATVFGVSAGWAPDPERTVTGLARGYWDLAGHLFTGRPVRLVGWSFGALAGYEIARLAVAAGHRCRLVMLDPWVPAAPGTPVPDDALVRSFFHNLSQGRLDASGTGTTGGLGAALAAARARYPQLGSLTEDTVGQLFERYRDNAQALQRYRLPDDPRVCPTIVAAGAGLGLGGADHLVALRSAVGTAALPGAVWHHLDGDHFSMVDPAHADEIAAIVGEGLRA